MEPLLKLLKDNAIIIGSLILAAQTIYIAIKNKTTPDITTLGSKELDLQGVVFKALFDENTQLRNQFHTLNNELREYHETRETDLEKWKDEVRDRLDRIEEKCQKLLDRMGNPMSN